jgi:hypothetical protein
MNRLITLLLLSITLFSCKENKIEQGEIEYKITYPYNSNVTGVMEMMLPKELSVKFKGTKMIATIKRGKIFTTQIVSDEATQKLEMRLDFGSDVINTFLTPDDVDLFLKTQPKYTVSKPQKADSLVGCSAVKYIIDCANDTLPPFDCYFTEDLTIQDAAWFTALKGAKGMPLVYLIDRFGIIMKVEATKFTPKEITEKDFEPTENYTTVPFSKYDKKLNDLFEIMME